MSPLNRRRIANFKANKRGYISLWIFGVLFFISLFAEFIANDKPILIFFDGKFLFPVLKLYPETRFGGEFETEADYHDEYVANLIKEQGWNGFGRSSPYSYDSVAFGRPAPHRHLPRNRIGSVRTTRAETLWRASFTASVFQCCSD